MSEPNATELELLKLFWRDGPMSAREVQTRAEPELGWAVSTTRTMLERMRAKGLLERRSVHGLAVYSAAGEKVQIIGAVLGRVRRLLDLDRAIPAAAFTGSSLLTEDELAELDALLKADAERDA